MEIRSIATHVSSARQLLSDGSPDLLGGRDSYKEAQLRAIRNSIRQLEKRGVPVPNEMTDLRTSLESDITSSTEDSTAFDALYEDVIHLAVELARRAGRNVRKDLVLVMAKQKESRVRVPVVADAVIQALSEAGGSAPQQMLVQRLETILQDQLSPSDKAERQAKGGANWLETLYRARRGLVREGKVSVGKGGDRLWTLSR